MTEPSNLRDCPLCGGCVWPEDEASYVAKIEAATIAKVVGEIVAKLTKAQRAEVLRGSFSGNRPISVARALMRKGLMAFRVDSPNGRWGFIENTPLGLEVRAALAAMQEPKQ